MSSIFIQIASYRDPEIVPTLRNLLENKSGENTLHICVHDQYSEEDTFEKDLDTFILGCHEDNLVDFTVVRTPHKESKGACWARNTIQQEYLGEDYTLQLDSHHRFVPNWDKLCIDMVESLQEKGHKKPLLTGYIPSYNPENDPDGRTQEAWRMTFDRFIPEGAVFFLPEQIQGWQDLTEPVPARFYSAHFCFTLGAFSKEVQHDPQYYFHGEEISIAARAYTHGYDLFHTHKIIAWHEYTRKGRTKHWDDVNDWGKMNSDCHLRNRRLFSMDGEKYNPAEFGEYGWGAERSLRDYERYSGILFSKRAVQKSVIDKLDPPVTEVYETEEAWLASFSQIFKHCIDINYADVKETDYEFWVVAFEDKQGNTIHRKDADAEEIKRILNDPDGYGKVWREFPTTVTPVKWLVWPYSTSKTWCDKIEGNLANNQVEVSAQENILFIDIDGVLNIREVTGSFSHIKDYLVANLNKILEQPNIKVVVSSNWKWVRTVQELQDLFEGFGAKLKVIDKTEAMFLDNKLIPRGVEIKEWWDRNKDNYKTYVIIDDNQDMLYEQRDNFVKTDPNVGLTVEDVNRAISILNR